MDPVGAPASAETIEVIDGELSLSVIALGEKDFYRTCSIVSYRDETVLIDGPLTFSGARPVLAALDRAGKQLSKIIITCADPDYYFGLHSIVEAFPNADVFATAEVAHSIDESVDHKISVWTSMLSDDGPRSRDQIIVPQIWHSQSFRVGNGEIQFLESEDPSRSSYLWISALDALVGGVGIVGGMHNWMAEWPLPAQREAVESNLDFLMKLAPRFVVPGHMVATGIDGLDAIHSTLKYNRDFYEALSSSTESEAVIDRMMRQYPDLAFKFALEFGARVLTGEASWP